MESSILSEVDDTSILRTVLSICYWHALDWLPASRLTPPRSGLERSDFVPWPVCEILAPAKKRLVIGVLQTRFSHVEFFAFDPERNFLPIVSIDVGHQSGRKSVECGTAARRRSKVLMHR